MRDLEILLRLAGVDEWDAAATVRDMGPAELEAAKARALDLFEQQGVARLPTPDDVRVLLESRHPRVRSLGLRLTGRIPRTEDFDEWASVLPPRWFFEDTWGR